MTYGYDGAGRVDAVSGQMGSTPASYASAVTYWPHGAVNTLALGNGLTETTTYNSRLQAQQIQAGGLLTLGYGYGTADNGNVQSQTITRGSSVWTQTCGYDGVNRLASASEAGTGAWSETYGYDAFGNRWLASGSGLPGVTAETATGQSWYANTPVNNRVVGWGYDGAGNLMSISGGVRSSSYDAENRVTTATENGATASYSYDGEGRRVIKTLGGQTTVYVYDAAGNLAAEYGPSSGGGTRYLTADALGSTRLVTDVNGATVRCYDYLPFGEEIPSGYAGRSASCFVPTSPDTVSEKFTGKERDSETGLDYFGARYFASAQGRFTSPDNFLNDTTALDPQRWNLYAYARNNPLRYVDPNGDKIYAGDLSDDDREELLKRINATYGCTGCTSVDKQGYLQVDTSGLSKDMLAATDYLTGAINSTSFFARVQVSNNDPTLPFGETRLGASSVEWNGKRVNAALIRLDFGDDRWIGGDAAAKQTFLNTVFAHEVAHVFPTYLRDPQTMGPTGPVVDTVNRITDVLGEPRRTGYMSSPVGGYWLSLPFSKTTVDKNGQTKEKAVQIEWMKRNVGGRGVN